MARDRQTGAFRRMAAVQLEDVRAHRAIKGVPYVPRDCEPDVEHSLQQRRLLIVGPAMAGKTRLALQLVRDILPDHGFVNARDGTDLRGMLEVAPEESSLVVWLDDLIRFIGVDAINRHVLDLLAARGNVVVATMGSDSYDDLMSDGMVQPAGWGVPAWFGVPIRLAEWTEREFDRAARRGVAEPTLVTARRFGLSASVGGGPVLLRRLRAGSTTQPVGYAVVQAAADWRRTGTSAPLTHAVLIDLLPAYLGGNPAAAGPDALSNGVSWATTRVNGVALVEEADSGLEVLDYVLDHLRAEGSQIPEPVWDAALAQAQPSDLITVGFHAALGHARTDIAMAAYRRAAFCQDPDSASAAAVWLGALSQQAADLEEEVDRDRNEAARQLATDSADAPPKSPKTVRMAAVLDKSRGAPPRPTATAAHEATRDAGLDAVATQALIMVAQAPPSARPDEGELSTGRVPSAPSDLDLGIRREGEGDIEGDASASLRDVNSVEEPAPELATSIDTPNPEEVVKAAFELGMHRLKHRDLQGAMAAWQRALDSGDPEHSPAAALCMASVHNHRGDSDSAVTAYQVAIDSGHPDYAPEAALALGDLLECQGDIPAAMTAYQIAIDSGHATHTATATAKLSSVREEHDRVVRAAAYRRTIEERDPDAAPRAALLLAILCQSQNDSEGEAAAYEVVINYGHRDGLPLAAYNLGVLRQEAGDLDRAVAAWALAMDSGDSTYAPMAAYNLGIVHRDQDDVDAAIVAWRAAISSGDSEFAPAAALELGELRRDLGDLDGASALWQMTLESGHADYAAPAAFRLGVLRQDRDDVDGAVAAWQYAIDSRHLESAPAAALRLGHLRRAQGDLHRAAASYQLTIDSGHGHAAPEAAIYLGLLLEEHGDLAGAAAAYQLAIDSGHETEAPEAAVRLGLLMEKRGDAAAAAGAYQLAVDSADPVHALEAQSYLKNLANGVNNLGGALESAQTSPHLRAVQADGRDAEYPFLSADQARRLRVLVRDAFLVRGVDVTISVGYAEAADGTRFDLQDVAASCHNAPGGQAQWPNVVNDQVGRILAAARKQDHLDGLTVEEVFSRAFLRVYDRGALGETDGYSYARPVVGDLVELLVLDLPDTVKILHRSELERFDWSALHSAALAHLLAETIDDYAVFNGGGGGTIHVAYGRSGYIASKLLILPDVLAHTVGKREPPHGVLVAVPNLHEIAFHPIVDRSAVPSLQQLSDFAANAHSEEDGAVSPFVYWWQEGRLTQLTRYDAAGHLVQSLDDTFQHVLNGLIGSA